MNNSPNKTPNYTIANNKSQDSDKNRASTLEKNRLDALDKKRVNALDKNSLRTKDKNNKTALDKKDKLNKGKSRKILIKKEDLRKKVRKHGIKASIILVIDMSGSMTSETKIKKVKTILGKIIKNVHINKDKLAVIGFRGKDSEIIIPNTIRPNSFLNNLQNLNVGGTTPMAAGLKRSLEIAMKESKNGEYLPLIMILSDGVTNVGLNKSDRLKNKSNKIKNNLQIKDYKDSRLKINQNLSNPVDDALAIGEEISKNNIQTVIVNFEKEKAKGRSINRELSSITNGRFYDLSKIADIYLDSFDIGEGSISSSNNNKKDLSSVDFNEEDISGIAIEEILNYERNNI